MVERNITAYLPTEITQSGCKGSNFNYKFDIKFNSDFAIIFLHTLTLLIKSCIFECLNKQTPDKLIII